MGGIGQNILNPATLSGALFYALFFLVLSLLLARVLKLGLQKAIDQDSRHLLDQTSLYFFTQLGRILIFVLAFALYAHLVPALRALGTALLASVSVLSIVVGLAAQNTLGNSVAGLSLLLYRPFLVGDQIQVTAPSGAEIGTVVRLTLGYTELQTSDNRRVVIPNSVMLNQMIVNYSTTEERKLCSVAVQISYDGDVEVARRILTELADRHPLIKEVASCPLTDLGDSSVTLTLYAWTANMGDALQAQRDLLEQVKQRFAQEGIIIPIPATRVILQENSPAKPAPATE